MKMDKGNNRVPLERRYGKGPDDSIVDLKGNLATCNLETVDRFFLRYLVVYIVVCIVYITKLTLN